MLPDNFNEMKQKRVVSLIPSATEIVAALGFGNWLAGRSHECDYPAAVLTLPVCTESKLDVTGSSAEIDRRVKAVLRDAISVYRVLTDVLEAVQPDVIITQSQCEICAVSLRDVETAVCELVSSRPRIVSLEPNRLADVWRDICQVADALDAPERGRELTASLQARAAAVAARSSRLETRPSVACIEWIEPVMAAGNWVPELVEMAGGRNLFGAAGRHSPWLEWEELRRADPEIIVIMPCGWDMDRAAGDMGFLTKREGWADLQAVRHGRVYLTDGNQYFNRPGPRLVESLEILAEICHPEQFRFGHAGVAWRQWREAEIGD